MTRDKLLEQITSELEHAAAEKLADCILPLLPQMPKLEWRENDDWGAAYLHIGDLRIGEIHKAGGGWHASAGGIYCMFCYDRESAKHAVEAKVKKALGWEQ
jgi:hypothetical protein